MSTSTISPCSIADPVIPPPKTGASRCPYLYPNGKRCSLPGLPSHYGFCLGHSQANARIPIPVPVHNDYEDLSADLLSELSSGTDLRKFLARLLILVTSGRISPRRASVLAYITNQLLHSNGAIILKSNPPGEKPERRFIDMPRPNRE
jgi:hypothetical protein